jgi:hypothetical protein
MYGPDRPRRLLLAPHPVPRIPQLIHCARSRVVTTAPVVCVAPIIGRMCRIRLALRSAGCDVRGAWLLGLLGLPRVPGQGRRVLRVSPQRRARTAAQLGRLRLLTGCPRLGRPARPLRHAVAISLVPSNLVRHDRPPARVKSWDYNCFLWPHVVCRPEAGALSGRLVSGGLPDGELDPDGHGPATYVERQRDAGREWSRG